MARFTKALRERIVRDFTSRHNGRFDPAVFVEEVNAAGPSHEAYEWFQWDDREAASQWRIEQARSFVQGIRIKFSVETVSRGNITIRQSVVPLVMSHLSNRRVGGGYVVTNTDSPDHMAEFCGQAARDLDAWLRRYAGAVLFAGGSTVQIERMSATLSEKAKGQATVKAA
jgi:hypothetical protein